MLKHILLVNRQIYYLAYEVDRIKHAPNLPNEIE